MSEQMRTKTTKCKNKTAERENKVIRPKSRASAFSEKSGKQTDEQTKTFKKNFELATKSLKNIFVTNQWTDRQMDRRTDRQTNKKVAHRGV